MSVKLVFGSAIDNIEKGAAMSPGNMFATISADLAVLINRSEKREREDK